MSRYDDLSDAARRLLADFDEIDLAEMLAAANTRPATPDPDAHVYLSTACHHGEHAYCQSNTGLNGAKKAAQCKWCGAICRCWCHSSGAGS